MSDDEFLPLILLFLFGGFAVLSAVLKIRARIKAPLGVALLLLEGLSGMALMAAALPTSGSLETASRTGILTAVVVALSSTVHLLKVRDRDRAREASEGRRLYAAVKTGLHTSGPTLGEDSGPAPDEDSAPALGQDD